MSTLGIVEELLGGPLDANEAERLCKAPDDQLAHFISRFASYWYGWLEQEAIRRKCVAGKPIYLTSGVGEYVTSGEALASYKRAALLFPEIAVPDPLAGRLHTTIEVANVLGTISIESTQQEFRAGLRRLAEIAPLVRSGAFILFPSPFCGLHPAVQKLAGEVVKGEAIGDEDDLARIDRDECAIATATANLTDAWPLADRTQVFDRMDLGVLSVKSRPSGIEFEVAKAVAKFDLPDASGISIGLLEQVRKDEPRLAEFRKKLTHAIARASSLAAENPTLFAEYLDDELRRESERCAEAIKMSPVLDGAIAPALAALSIAGAKVGWGDGFDISSAAELAKVSAEVVAPGAGWFIAQIIRRGVSPTIRANRRFAALYGCLAESRGSA